MISDFSLTGKTIIVTGASSGIGRECAITCSRYGANIIAIGRNTDRLMATIEQLKAGNHDIYAADISDFNHINEIVKSVSSKQGRIAGFIHAAGMVFNKPVHLTKPDDYVRMYDVNVLAGFEFIRNISKKGVYDSNGTSLILISSVMSLAGTVLKTSYCSSKGALVSGSRAMALELAPRGIRVNCISPGVVGTEMVERFKDKAPDGALIDVLSKQVLGLVSPHDIALGAVYLLSPASRFVTGTNLVIDGGYLAQ